MAGWIDLKLVDTLSLGLRGAAERQRAIAQNLANVNTPGYKRWDVEFEQAMHTLLSDSTAETSNADGVTWTHDTQTSTRADGNNVDLESELSLMTDNGLYQRTLAELLSGQFQRLKTVISGGEQ